MHPKFGNKDSSPNQETIQQWTGSKVLVEIWILLGWLLFLKVTYTYYWVNTSDAGSPRGNNHSNSI